MKRLFLLLLLLISSTAHADLSDQLNFEEADGLPSIYPYKVIVQSNTLTDNGDGTALIYASTDAVTFTNVSVNTEVYDATGWNSDLTVPTKDAVRDKFESLGGNVWQTTSNVANLVTATDNVTVGSSTNLAKVGIDGDADEIQLLVQANGTQTADIFVAENSVGSNLMTLSADGSLSVLGTGTDAMTIGGGSQATLHQTYNLSGTDPSIVATNGNISFSHDITVSGDNIAMLTNTKGGLLAADGTNFAPFPVGATNGMVLSVDSSTPTGLKWGFVGGGSGAGDMVLASAQTNTGVKTFNAGTLKFPDAAYIADANGNEILSFDTVGSATNYLSVINSATTTSPIISADGSDTNVGIKLNTKGTGAVVITTAPAAKSTISAGLTVNNSQNTNTTGGFSVISADGTRTLSADSSGVSFGGPLVSTSTSGIGWSFVDGTDNTTCDAQCTYGCVFGIANATGTAVTALLSCTDATADSCICAGNN